MYPSDRKYTADHLWVRLDGSRATVGVTQHMMEALCPVQYIELPTVGQSLEWRQTCGGIEGVKAMVELVSPLAGKVTGINTDLVGNPQPLCADPHGTWLIQFEVTDTKQIGQLLMNADYERLLKALPPAPPEAKSPPKPAPKVPPPPKAEVKPAPKAPAVPPPKPPAPAPPAVDADAVAAAWITRLRGTSLTISDASFDPGYSGGSTFFSRECVITLGEDQRFVWRETTSSRVSTAGLSFSSPPSRKTYTGTWTVTVTGGFAFLVLEDSARGRPTYRLQERGRGTLLLDDKAYSWSRG